MSYAIRNDGQGWRAVNGPGDVGPDEYYSEELIEIIPSVVVPEYVTMRQARLALLKAGLLDQVNSALNTLQGAEGEAARIEWEYSQEVWRNRPFVIQLGDTLGLTPEQIDDLFIKAATL